MDFDAISDTIALDHMIFGGLSIGLLSASAFDLDSAKGPGTEIVYDQTTGALFYDSNGSAAGGSTRFATVSGTPSLTSTSFRVE